MRGLVSYLCTTESPRDVRANQHEHPRLVGGEAFASTVYGGRELDRVDAAGLAGYLDAPRRAFEVSMQVRVYEQNAETGARQVATVEGGGDRWRDEHVWHASLSLADGESFTDEQWGEVVQGFADEMGFTQTSGKAPARWVAIHHGAGKGGHDHVHIAASMVREDGTRWSSYRDFPRAQQACRELERKHGLVQVLGREYGTATLGASPAELSHQLRNGLPVVAREEVAQRVRAAAVAAATEAEWVRRLRADGVVVRPRFAEGTTDVVVGYRAALKGQDQLRFYGGGRLGRDLSLPRLREMWGEPTVAQSDSASAEWQAAHHGKPPTREGREAKPLTPTAPEVARANLAAYSAYLGRVSPTDRVAWSMAAREVSGALSAWSRLDPTNRDVLREAAEVVGRTAQDRRAGAGRARRDGRSSGMGAATMLLAMRGDKPALAAAALMAQILAAAMAIRDAQRAGGNLREAQAVTESMRQLTALQWSGYAPEPTNRPAPVIAAASQVTTPTNSQQGRTDHAGR